MKFPLILMLLLSVCSTHSPQVLDRQLASGKMVEFQKFELTLSQDLVVANGVNTVQLSIVVKDDNGNLVILKPSDIDIVTSIDTKLSEIISKGPGLEVNITPKIKSPPIKILVTTQNSQSQTIILKTTMQPIREKLVPIKFGASNNSTIDGVSYSRQDNFPEGQYEGLGYSNNGKNRIVSAEDSSREFSFDFEEQARQNLSMLVQDAPNGTSSHAMFSHFIFFPRLIIPYAEVQNNQEVLVTLTTGEEIRFNKEGEIIAGVFEEGPVDAGPDRFTRNYANLKYHGKGIILRANARGQMPQQGQFETTKIDMEYGIKYSADVLIINGTTGERCRRPKKDFWSDADVSPIEFKFPSDTEFDAYLKVNCKFGIPSLTLQSNPDVNDSYSSYISKIWRDCKNDPQIKSCIDSKVRLIADENNRSRVHFEMVQLLFKAKLEENNSIAVEIATETSVIRPKLLIETSWVSSAAEAQIKEDCLKKSLALNTLAFRFNNSAQLMKQSLVIACSSIKSDLDNNALDEVKNLITPLSDDLSWINLSNGQTFSKNCQKEFVRRYTNLNFQNAQGFYTQPLNKYCALIENGEIFKTWLSTQAVAIENRLFLEVQTSVATSTESMAQDCVEEFPMNTTLNRLRFKKQREACLIDAWPELEAKAVIDAQRDSIAQKVGISATNLILRLEKNRRTNQLKLIKKFFIQ